MRFSSSSFQLITALLAHFPECRLETNKYVCSAFGSKLNTWKYYVVPKCGTTNQIRGEFFLKYDARHENEAQ